jgi:taurine dioxygenase
MQVKPLTDLLGAEITGFDLTRPLDQAVKRELYQHFVDNAVLVFRDQHFDPPQFAAAAQIFGEIIPEQFPNYRLPQYPTVSFLSNSDLQKSGKRRAVRGEGFHTDHSNYAAPPKATILYGIDIPQSGGDTEFVSVQAAYDDLSDDRRVEGGACLQKHSRQTPIDRAVTGGVGKDATRAAPDRAAQSG